MVQRRPSCLQGYGKILWDFPVCRWHSLLHKFAQGGAGQAQGHRPLETALDHLESKVTLTHTEKKNNNTK